MSKKFKWVVEFEVDKVWVEDGFNLTDERALEMLQNDLQCAYSNELKARVISAPDPYEVLKVQGYEVDKLSKAEKTALLK